MARPKKTLEDLCLVDEPTFLGRRHARLLDEEPLLDEPHLRALQEEYRAEGNELERRALAVRFEKAVRVAARTTLADERERMLAELDAIVHAPAVLVDQDAGLAEAAKHMEAVMCRGLRSSGLSYRAIGEQIGKSGAAVRRLVLWLERITPAS